MIIKKQSLLAGVAAAIFVIALSAPVRAQDRDQIQNLASELSNEAREAWNAMQNAQNTMDLDDNPSAQRLYSSLQDFNRRARLFTRESREGWEQPARLRNMARQLVDEASRIDA